LEPGHNTLAHTVFHKAYNMITHSRLKSVLLGKIQIPSDRI